MYKMQRTLSVATGDGERTTRRAKEGDEIVRQAPELPVVMATNMRALN